MTVSSSESCSSLPSNLIGVGNLSTWISPCIRHRHMSLTIRIVSFLFLFRSQHSQVLELIHLISPSSLSSFLRYFFLSFPLIYFSFASLFDSLSFPLTFFPFSLIPSYDTVRPLDVRITSERRPLSAGHKVQLTCQSNGSRPAAIITWWLGSKRILHHISDQVSESLNVTTSILHFVPSSEENGQTLYCRSDHSILPDSALEDSWTLNVYCKFSSTSRILEQKSSSILRFLTSSILRFSSSRIL